MQISKSFLVVCAAAYCVALLPLRAADADTELKLREALEKKLDELQTQPPVAAPQPKKKAAPAPAATPVPTPAVQSTVRPVLMAPPPADAETIAKARAALRQKMAEMDAQSAPAPAAPAQPAPAVQPMPAAVPAMPAPPPAVSPPVMAQPTPVPAPAVQAAPPPVDSETIAKAREALRQKMKELEMQPPAEAHAVAPAAPKPAPEAKPVAVKPQEPMAKPEVKPPPAATPPPAPMPVAEKPPKKPASVKVAPAFPPIGGPPPGISADKEQRLQELLRKYRADQITPEEYHQQRAKILAEP